MTQAERHTLDYGKETHPTVSQLTTLFNLLGGGIAWFLHLFVVYLIGEFGCRANWGDWRIGSLSMVTLLLILTTMLTIALALSAIFTSTKTVSKLGGKASANAVIATENKYFIARTSRLLNAIFAFIILIQAIPIFFYLRTC